MLLTFDFGGTFAKFALLDESSGDLHEKGQAPAPLESEEAFCAFVAGLYQRYKGQIRGIAISMPGVLNTETGFAYSAGSYSKTLSGKNIYHLLRQVTPLPVAIENDAKSAILAEQWLGALQGVGTAAVCIIGSGLGGGLILEGKLQKGAHFAAGEISGLLMEAGNYQSSGLAATQAGTSALLRDVALANGMNPADFEISPFMLGDAPPSTRAEKISGKEVFGWIDAGDETTLQVYGQWLQKLTLVLFNIKMTLDPEVILIGGGVSRNPRLLPDLRREFAKLDPVVAMFGNLETRLEACHFSADANLVGACYNWLSLYDHRA